MEVVVGIGVDVGKESKDDDAALYAFIRPYFTTPVSIGSVVCCTVSIIHWPLQFCFEATRAAIPDTYAEAILVPVIVAYPLDL